MIRKITLLLFLFNCATLSLNAQEHSLAREWNEVLLEAIRNDFARPTVHARNLFHTAIAMYDAWAVFDEDSETFFLGQTVAGFTCPFEDFPMPEDIEAARGEAISYAVYRLLGRRFRNSPGAALSINRFNTLMAELGYNTNLTSQDYSTGSAAALGNYIGNQLILFGLQDNANEQNDYENQFYEPVNEPLVVELPGNSTISDYNRWQPLTLDVFIDQAGNVRSGETPPFLSPEWGRVVPFALSEEDRTIYQRDGFDYWVYHDPGPPALMDITGTEDSEAYKWSHSMVSVWSSHLSPDDDTEWDISPASIGNVQLEDYPTTIEELPNFYNYLEGGDIGQGRDLNPVSGRPYEPQMVKRGDYARILAEFWADGPDSETPPGHWFTILNYVNDHPMLVKQFAGAGEVLDDLEWDVKAYMTLGGAMHDAAVTVWGIKGWYDYLRPISAIRGMAALGQSTDPDLPNYHPGGLPLIDGYIDVVKPTDPFQLRGLAGRNVGKIKIKTWKGPDYVRNPAADYAGVDWILAEEWWPYQRPTFVSPNFAGYVSGHSAYSRAAAEVLTALTGDPFFPGGMGEFHAPAGDFLVFEDGPSEDVTLQWATYRDASDQCSLSRIWGGIHPPVDDIPARLMGIEIGTDAFTKARDLFYKDGDQDGFYSYEDCNDNNPSIFPGAEEVCDNEDNNCNNTIDEGVQSLFYLDLDQDGYGDPNTALSACTSPDAYVSDNTDCNDGDGNEFPGQIWYLDLDGDQFGSGETVVSCQRPANGFLAAELLDPSADCDDLAAAFNPDIAEVCDGLDNNCDGRIDEDLFLYTYYMDVDGDGFGNAAVSLDTCQATPPTGFVLDDSDCDDTNNSIYPNAAELADNGIDEDCNGVDLFLATKLYPNPVRDQLRIHYDYDAELELRMYNAQGRLVYRSEQEVINNQLIINVDFLSSGMYFLFLYESDGKEIPLPRIIKQ